MSDLQCPVRVLVARHGQADYETDLLSDHGGTLSPLGRDQSRGLGATLAGDRVARVWSSPMSRAVQTAEIAAALLGCDVLVREGLREFGVGAHAGRSHDPDLLRPTFVRWLAGDLGARVAGGESGTELVGRFAGVLEEVADLHRGETVLVVSHGGAICTGVPALADNLDPGFAHGRSLPHGGVVELAGDADGWRAVAWLGERV